MLLNTFDAVMLRDGGRWNLNPNFSMSSLVSRPLWPLGGSWLGLQLIFVCCEYAPVRFIYLTARRTRIRCIVNVSSPSLMNISLQPFQHIVHHDFGGSVHVSRRPGETFGDDYSCRPPCRLQQIIWRYNKRCIIYDIWCIICLWYVGRRKV